MHPPDYKLIPNTGFSVDGFRYPHASVKAYFLSHAHADHYGGITEAWHHGEVWCTPLTGKLVCHITNLNPSYIRELPLDTPVMVHGVEVTAVDANHCPGAAILLFELPDGSKYVHCGDMRYHERMRRVPVLQRFVSADAVYLDTTYCHPKHVFPAQEESVAAVARLCEQYLAEAVPGRLIMISAYTIGKEKIFIDVARRCKVRLCVTAKKMDLLQLLDWPHDRPCDSVFTTDPAETPVHVVGWNWIGETWPFFRPNYQNMEEFCRVQGAKSAIGFVPTGWTYQTRYELFPVHEKEPFKIHLIPYSEHSSFPELQEWVSFLRPRQLVPTVGVSGDKADANIRRMMEHFRNLIDSTAAKRAFLGVFAVKPAAPDGPKALEQQAVGAADGGTAIKAQPAEGGPEADLEPVLMAAAKSEAEEVMGPAQSSMLHDGTAVQSGSGGAAANASGLVKDRAAAQVQQGKADNGAAADQLVPEAYDAGGAVSAMHAPDKSEQKCPSVSKDTALLLTIIGNDVSHERASSLISKAKGSVTAAVNMFYDAAVSPATATTPRKHASVAGKAPATKSPAATPRKRSAPGSAIASNRSAKKPKPTSAAQSRQQRAITAFFAAPGAGARGIIPSPAPATFSPPLPPSPSRLLIPPSDPSVTPPPSASPHRPTLAALIATQEDNDVGARSDSHAAAVGATRGNSVTDAAQCGPHDDDAGCPRSLPAASQSGSQAFTSSPSLKLPGLPKPSLRRAASTSEQGSGPPDKPGQSRGAHTSAPADAAAGSDSPELRIATASTQHAADGHNAAATGAGTFQGPNGTACGSADAAAGARPCADTNKVPVLLVSLDTLQNAADAPVALPVERYNPIEQAIWSAGPTPYAFVATAFAAMDSTTKRLRIGDVLTNMFRSIMAISPVDLEPAVYLAVGKIAPDYEGGELQIGGSTVAHAIAAATGVTNQKLSEAYTQLGDLGDVAAAFKQKQSMLAPLPPLTVPDVFTKLRRIADAKGVGSASRKQQIVASLLRACKGHEIKYLVRTLVRNLRVGANWRSVVSALGRAAACHEAAPAPAPPKATLDGAAETAVEAFHRCPNLTLIIGALRNGGIWKLPETCVMALGVPLQPMLAKITEGFDACVRQIAGRAVLAEYKYDGQRAQIHVDVAGQVRIFSRQCEDKTRAFPDVVAAVLEAAGFSPSIQQQPGPLQPSGATTSFIVDAEVVGIDRSNGNRLRAFQDLSTRAREAVTVEAVDQKGDHVCVFLFDMMYRDGRSLLSQPLRQRRCELKAAFPGLRPGFVQLAQAVELRVGGEGEAGPAPAVAGSLVQPLKAEDTAGGVVVAVDAASDGAGEQSGQPDSERGWNAGDLGRHGCAGEAAAATAAPATSLLAAADADALTGVHMDAGWAVQELQRDKATEQLERLLLEAIADGTEGLMLKALDERSAYQPSKRSDSWLKVKRDYCENLRDSLDLVVIGAWYGNGRKTGWYSPFLLAAWDREREEFQSMCRVMSGFSDAFYVAAKARLDSRLLPGKRPYYNTAERPDVWFDAAEVWEIRGADLTISPVHKAAVGRLHESRGCSLRFPRFIQIREDKAPEDASGPDYIVDLFQAQTRKTAM